MSATPNDLLDAVTWVGDLGPNDRAIQWCGRRIEIVAFEHDRFDLRHRSRRGVVIIGRLDDGRMVQPFYWLDEQVVVLS